MGILAPLNIFGYIYKPNLHPHLRKMKNMWAFNLPTPPDVYSSDAQWPDIKIPDEMYDNDVLGCCVMAGRAHMQNRLLVGEYGPSALNQVLVTSDQVKAEYFAETGGQDTGLVPDDSLNIWMKQGWMTGTPAANHKIAAWGRVDATSQLDLMRAIWLLYGVQLDVCLPTAWIDAFNAGGIWDIPTDSQKNDPNWQLDPNQGHNVYSYQYNQTGPIIDTWGSEIQATWKGVAWAFSEANQGEVEAVVRLNDDGVAQIVDGLDTQKLQSELLQVEENN